MIYTIHKEYSENEYSVFIYIPNILDFELYDELTSWLQQKHYKNGTGAKNKPIPRLQLWFQENENYFCKSWKTRLERWKSEPYERMIYKIQGAIRKKLEEHDIKSILPSSSCIDTSFVMNSCLINYYRHGYDSIHPHRDCIDSFGIYPTIMGLSIGATRMMNINRVYFNNENIKSCKRDPNQQGINMTFPLEDNSLFIMMGTSQKYYTHEILKEPHIIEPRYSLTFRKYIE